MKQQLFAFLAVITMVFSGAIARADVASEVLALVNDQRAAAGCGPLAANAKLAKAAQRHANAMAAKNFFDHKGKDGSTFGSRIKAAGYKYSQAAENIAAGHSTPAKVVSKWMASAGHRKNILNCAYTETGIGHVFEEGDTPLPGQKYAMKHYWSQNFAAP